MGRGKTTKERAHDLLFLSYMFLFRINNPLSFFFYFFKDAKHILEKWHLSKEKHLGDIVFKMTLTLIIK